MEVSICSITLQTTSVPRDLKGFNSDRSLKALFEQMITSFMDGNENTGISSKSYNVKRCSNPAC